VAEVQKCHCSNPHRKEVIIKCLSNTTIQVLELYHLKAVSHESHEVLITQRLNGSWSKHWQSEVNENN